MQGRDNVLGGFVQNLDTLTSNMISQFNQVYASGQGTDGYTSVTSENAVSDPTAALNQAGLAFTPQNGTFQVAGHQPDHGTDDDFDHRRQPERHGQRHDARQSGEPNSTAWPTSRRRSRPTAISRSMPIRTTRSNSANDSSNTLASLGINTFFTGNDSSNIGVNSARDGESAARSRTAQGGGPSDGSNALALSQFASNSVSGLNGREPQTVITTRWSRTSATRPRRKRPCRTSQNDYSQSLTAQQQQISGVSLDQQAIQMMQYQQSYQASAKMVTTINQLFQTLLQM